MATARSYFQWNNRPHACALVGSNGGMLESQWILEGGHGGDGIPLAFRREESTLAFGVMQSGRLNPLVFSVVPVSLPSRHRPAPRIELHEATWQRHILTRHPELVGKEQEVEEVVRNPSELYLDRGSYLFLNRSITDSSAPPLPLRVVVRGGLVLTAYYVASIVGTKIWP
jgi:hypothetical protein